MLPYLKTVFNKEDFYSDHLPITVTVPVDASNPDSEQIKILSRNVMGAPFKNSADWFETEEDNNKTRYQRIAQVLKSSGADIFTLQEVEDAEGLMAPILEDILGEAWEIVSARDRITCFKKEQFTLKDTKDDVHERILTTELRHNASKATMVVNNVWGIYYFYPFTHERLYSSVLKKKPKGTKKYTNIVVGDTNCHIAPLHDELGLITTGLIPYGFNVNNGIDDERVRLADFPDGAFIATHDGEIRQLDHEVLYAENGELKTLSEIDYAPTVPSEGEPNHAINDDLYRPIIGLDPEYKELMNSLGIFNRDKAADKLKYDILAKCLSANHYNVKAVTLVFKKDSHIFRQIRNELKNEKGITFNIDQPVRSGLNCDCISVTYDQLDVLNEYLEKLDNNEIYKKKYYLLISIEKQIERLQKHKKLFFHPVKKLASLNNLSWQIKNLEIDDKTTVDDLLTLVENWETQENEDNKSNHDIMAENRHRFLKRLHKPEKTKSEKFIDEIKSQLTPGT